jgi:hypothetical protein
MTDGEYNKGDPEPIARRLMSMEVPDGNVLVENIYVATSGLDIPDVSAWPGVSSEDELPDQYAKTLFRMSSPIPDSYRSVMREFGYRLESGARMFFPGEEPSLVELGFTMSGATPVTSAD